MGRRDDDLDRELRTHLELEAEERRAAGLSSPSAEYAARAEFGDIMLTKERTREMWGWSGIDKLVQDLKYGLRGIRRSPGFVSVAMLSLALGIGATTALFSVVYGVLIAPYPYAKPDHIWAPAVVSPKETPQGWHQYSRREFLELQKLPAFSEAMATDPAQVLLTGDRTPENDIAVQLTGNAFNFLGVKPLLGRTIQPFDIGPGGEAATVAVVSYAFWQRVFSGRPDVLGAKIVLDDVPRTIIGVMPPRFGWWTSNGVWIPMQMDTKDTRGINPIVRLAPGVTAEAAAASLQVLNQRLAEQTPAHFPQGTFRTTLLNYMDITVASGEMTSSLHILLAAVGFLLLIACANVANLQLARTTARIREIAMRLSIGASRGRIVRQLLTESVLLSLLGGLLGVLLAVGLTRAAVALMPEFYVPNEARITVNAYVLLFSFLVSVSTGVIFGLAPAIECTRPNLTDALKDGSRGSGASTSGRTIRGALVMAEVALSVVLLAGASLSVRSFAELLRIDPGFQPERTLMVSVPLPPKQYKSIEQRNAFAETLLQRVESLPGVEAATIGVEGRPSRYTLEGSASITTEHLSVSLIGANYARALGIPLKRGRTFTQNEIVRGSHIALVNEAAARLWPAGTDAIGRHLSLDVLANAGKALLPASPTTGLTVVGILGDIKNNGLRNKTDPAIYVPYTLIAPPSRLLAMRTRGEPKAMLNAIREVTREIDKRIPIERPVTLQEILGQETAQPRFTMALLACFAALGLALAAAGIYSVISCDVTQKIHEIGVRVALGATRGNVLVMILTQSARMVGIGLAIGLAGSLALERILRSRFFGSATLDGISATVVIAALAVVAMAASWAPARRAAKMHPVDALRYEA
jgi:putative ABC transport system permease protein